MLDFEPTKFILIVLYDIHYCFYSLYQRIFQQTYFSILKLYICKFKGSNKSFSKNRFSFVMCSVHSYIVILQPWLHWSTIISTTFMYPYFFGLRLNASKIFSKALIAVIPFESYKAITPCVFTKDIITHNKNRIALLNVLINFISARSAPQILSIKDECAFRFSNFLIIDLCNSSAYSWFHIFSFSIPPPELLALEGFLLKICKPSK